MMKPIPFTELSLQRAINAARKAGARLVVRPDGSMVFEDLDGAQSTDNPQPEIALEPEQDVVL